MLKKKERLNRKEFDRSFSIGRRIHSPHLQLIYSPTDTFHGAVVVGKKVAKKAVERNRIRRQIYSMLYKRFKDEKVPMTYIIITKKGFNDLDKTQRAQEVSELLKKAPGA